MATKTLYWENTTVNASANASGQRALKRLTSTAGAYSDTNFSPANPLPKTAVTSTANMLLPNRLYDFRVEALCTEGGPTQNTNGIVQGIAFECITPSIVPGATNIEISINLAGTDITKARIVLKLAADDSVINTQVIARSGDTVYYNFTALSPGSYYFETEFYATVNGVEVISSSEPYLGTICGGDVEGYQIATASNAVLINNTSSTGVINSITPSWFFITEGFIPTLPGTTAVGEHGSFAGNFGVEVSVSGASLKLFINGAEVDCIAVLGPGTYTFEGVLITSGQNVEIRLLDSLC